MSYQYNETQSNANGPTTYHASMYQSLGGIPESDDKMMGNVPSMGTQVIPIDATLGYEALTHNVPPTSSAYFGIDSAYPSFPVGTCTRFVLRKCDGVVQDVFITDQLPTVPK